MHLVALVSLQNGLLLAAAAADIPLHAAIPGFLIAIPLGLALTGDHAQDRLAAERQGDSSPRLGVSRMRGRLLAASLIIPLDAVGASFAPLVAAWGLAVAWSHRRRQRPWPARLADLVQLIALLAAVCLRTPVGTLLALFIAMAAATLPAARRRLDALVLGSCAAGLTLFGSLTLQAASR